MIGRLPDHCPPQTTALYAHLARHFAKNVAEKIADTLLADVNAVSGKSAAAWSFRLAAGPCQSKLA